MAAYATRSDLDDFGGLPDGALANAGRLASFVSTAKETIDLDAHGFVTGDDLALRPLEGGVLPTPLNEETTYYAIRVSDSRFKVALSENDAHSGIAVDLTTVGSGVVVLKPLPIDRQLERYSRWVDGLLPAHLVPLKAPYPIEITAIVAQVAAAALLNQSGKASEIVEKAETVAMAQVARWSKGIPLRDAAVTASANLAVTTSLSSDETTDPRGWGSRLIP